MSGGSAVSGMPARRPDTPSSSAGWAATVATNAFGVARPAQAVVRAPGAAGAHGGDEGRALPHAAPAESKQRRGTHHRCEGRAGAMGGLPGPRAGSPEYVPFVTPPVGF